jgi:hypothetical protein
VDDSPALLNLLRCGGLLGESPAESDLIERAHRLARQIFVANDEAEGLVGMMALFERSPSSLWGADFVVDPLRGTAFVTAVEIWRAVLRFAVANGFDWISTKPKPGSSRTRDFYRLMGVPQSASNEMETPLPLCLRMWEDVGDAVPLVPTCHVAGSVLAFRARRTLIEVDRDAGLAVCRDKATGQELARRHTVGLPSLVGSRTAPGDPSPTLLRLAQGVTLLPPLWSWVATHGLQLPVCDQWPWTVRVIDDARLEMVQESHAAAGETGRMTARLVDQAWHFALESERPYMRLLFECQSDVSLSDDGLTASGGVTVHCRPTPVSRELFEWNSLTRVALHCANPITYIDVEMHSPIREVLS